MYDFGGQFYLYLAAVFVLPSALAIAWFNLKKPVDALRFGAPPHGRLSLGSGVVTALVRGLNFTGRATRSQFWWFVLIYFTVLLPVGYLVKGYNPVLGYVVYALIAVPMLSVGVRRLHDIGRSGLWWLLLPTVLGVLPLIVLWTLPGQKRQAEPESVF